MSRGRPKKEETHPKVELIKKETYNKHKEIVDKVGNTLCLFRSSNKFYVTINDSKYIEITDDIYDEIIRKGDQYANILGIVGS